MTAIRGASQFLNQSTLSNLRGSAAQGTNVLAEAAGGAGILEIGRNLASSGLGISNNARGLNRAFLQKSSGTYNQLFSASGGGSSSVDAAQLQILGLRASVTATRATPEAREDALIAAREAVAAEAAATETVDSTSPELGTVVDESV